MLPLMAMMAGSAVSGIGNVLAANTQANAARAAGQQGWLGSVLAAQAGNEGYNRANAALSPYVTGGSKTFDLLQSYLTGNNAQKAGIGGGGPTLMSTFQPTQAQLESTPGYQWARQQALGAMANSGAAKGLGISGNLVQQLGTTATGLASQTFQQQLENYLKQNQQAFGMLFNPSQLGMQAGSSLAGAATDAAKLIGGASMGAGNAMGQSIMNAGTYTGAGTNALFGGIGNAMSMPYMAANFNRGTTPSSTNGGAGSAFSSMMPDWLRYGFGGSGNLPTNVLGGAGDRPIPTYY